VIILFILYYVYIFISLISIAFLRFGGGPACTHLYECPTCEEKYESLQKRRQYEMELFQRLNTDNTTAIYALAMAWLRQWQSFVRGKETQPPGPIDNNSIVVNKNGQNSLKVGKSSSISISKLIFYLDWVSNRNYQIIETQYDFFLYVFSFSFFRLGLRPDPRRIVAILPDYVWRWTRANAALVSTTDARSA